MYVSLTLLQLLMPHLHCPQRHENIKKCAHAQCVCEVEHVTFTPLVMSASGGLAHDAIIFYKRLAS